jgi:hypothetical protein
MLMEESLMEESVPLLPCRPVRAATVAVNITSSGACIRDRYNQLLAALPDAVQGGPPSRVAEVRIGLVQPAHDETSGALVELMVDGGRELPPWTDEGVCETRILTSIDRWALDSEPDRLHLHAGLVSRDGVGCLVVGPKGAGKSTLVTHLVRSGWLYHSDEMVGFSPEDPLVGHGFARPPSLKPGSWPLFADLPTVRARRQRRRARDRIHVTPGELGAFAGPDGCRVRAIVFLTADDPSELTPISPSEAIERCVAETMDLGRSGVSGMGTLVHLITGAQLFRLGPSELGQAARIFGGLAELSPVEAGSLACELATSDRRAGEQRGSDQLQVPIGAHTKLWRAEGAASWSLGEGAVVYDPSREKVTCLNPSAAEIWRRLAGNSAADLARQLAGGAPSAWEAIVVVLQKLYDEGLVEA